jgi:glucose-6-phosphate 1-dehydrogenase
MTYRPLSSRYTSPQSDEKCYTMDIPQSDAFVFFGATGDLAFKKIFPALQAMIKHGHLDVPVIGVARSAKNVDEEDYVQEAWRIVDPALKASTPMCQYEQKTWERVKCTSPASNSHTDSINSFSKRKP